MSDNENEAWDDLLFNPERYDDDGGHYADSLSYLSRGRRGGKTVRHSGLEDRINIMTLEPVDNPQPEFHLLRVSKMHRETALAYLVTGTIEFDPPFRGETVAEINEQWIPKSRCLVTGYDVRIPHWLVKKKLDYPSVLGRAPVPPPVNLSALKSQAVNIQMVGRAFREGTKNPFQKIQDELDSVQADIERYKHLKNPF